MDIRKLELTPMSSSNWIQFISDNHFSSEELCWLYCCRLNVLLTDQESFATVTKAMLDRGMDPNGLVTREEPDENPEKNYYHIPLIEATRAEDDSTTAESLKLLLEHGGDPNTLYEFGSFEENVFEFYVEDEFANGPDLSEGSFYGLLLCYAYGGRQRSGHRPFTMLTDAPISVFKDYKRYWYEYDKRPDHQSTLYVVEKDSGKRIAQYH